MSATRFTDALAALLGLYRAAAALDGVPVYDSATVTAAADPDFIVVGHDGTLAADGTLSADALAGTFTQSDFAMGPLRQETGYLNCVIVSQSGDADGAAGRRQRASDLLGAAEDAAMAGQGLQSGAAAGIMLAGTSDGRFATRLSLGGVAVVLPYRVYYSTGW